MKKEIKWAAAGCALAAVLFCAPWFPNARTIPTTYFGIAEHFARLDSSLWTYFLAWGAHNPGRFYDAPILLPMPTPLIANDPRLTEGIWTIPLFLVFEPFTAWGISLWIALACSSLGAYAAGRYVTGSAWGGAAVTTLFGFGTFYATHICHIEGIFAPALPLAIAGIAAFFDRQDRRRALLFALALAFATIEYSYAAVALALIVPAAVLWGAWKRRIGYRLPLASLASAYALVAVILAPIAVKYAEFHRATNLSRLQYEVNYGGADIEAWLTGPTGTLLPPFGGEGAHIPDARLFPGFVCLLLGIAGMRELWRRSPEIAVAGGISFLLSLGTMRKLLWRLGLPYIPIPTPYEILYDWLLPIQAIRAPGRLALVSHLVLALAAAFTVVRWSSRSLRWRIGVALLLGAAFLEARLGMHEISVLPDRVADESYAWVAKQEGNFAVLDAPLGRTFVTNQDRSEAESLFAALIHGKRTPNGVMAMTIPWHESIAAHLARPRAGEAQVILRALGVKYVIARDAETGGAFGRAGLKPVYFSRQGSTVLEVESPQPIPVNPAEFQERVLEMPHTRVTSFTRGLRARIAAPETVDVRAGANLRIPLVVKNTGKDTWCVHGAIFGLGPRGDIAVGSRSWKRLDRPGTPMSMSGDSLLTMSPITGDLAPGETVAMELRGPAPVSPGDYELALDLFAIGVQWFHPADSAPARVRVNVRSWW